MNETLELIPRPDGGLPEAVPKPKFVLRDYQQRAVDAGANYLMGPCYDEAGLMMLPTGCHAAGTEILMVNGSSVRVEDVLVGDRLMGPDGRARVVRNLCRGEEMMYRIIPHTGGSPFVVNANHILSLYCTNEGVKAVCPSHKRGGEREFIRVKDYLAKPSYWKHLRKLHRCDAIEFETENPLPIDPWMLGVILGDGSTLNGVVNVTTDDDEIKSGVLEFVKAWELRCSIAPKSSTRAITMRIVKKAIRSNRTIPNPLMMALKILGIAGKGSGDKFIPWSYKTSSKISRLQLLAGLLDTDGHHDGHGGFDYISKSSALASDLAFIVRSLGLTAHESVAWKSCQTGVGGNYFRVHISGHTNQIPCRVSRKQAPARRQKKNNLVTGFTIEPVEVGKFYGFELSGDHLYLTSDFMVHHNSGKSLVIAGIVHRLDGPCIVFQPSREILEQNADKLRGYGYSPSIWSASLGRKELGEITLATIGSVIRHKETFAQFRYVIIDECDAVNAKGGMYSDFLAAMPQARVIGMTATPYRLTTDGFGGSILKFLTRTRPRVFKHLIFHVQNGDLFRDGYLCPLEYQEVKTGFDETKLRLNTTGADYTDESVRRHFAELHFSDKIVRCVNRLLELQRPGVLVFTRFVEEAQYVADHVPGAAIVTAETPDAERRRVIWKFRQGIIPVVCNVGVLLCGFDYPELSNVVLARPTMSLRVHYQQIGRAVRTHPNKQTAWIVDMVGLVKKFGRVEDLELACGAHETWFVRSQGRQLTNCYFGQKPDYGREKWRNNWKRR